MKFPQYIVHEGKIKVSSINPIKAKEDQRKWALRSYVLWILHAVNPKDWRFTSLDAGLQI